MKKLSEASLLLLICGTFCFGLTLLTPRFISISMDVDDFLKGFGTALMLGAVIVQMKKRKTSLS